MLNKFELESNITDKDPRVQLAENWAGYVSLLQTNPRLISKIMGDSTLAVLTGKMEIEYFAPEVESQFEIHLPELLVAINGMRKALDTMQGWKIDWRQYRRGETIGADISSGNNFTSVNIRRAPPEFYEKNGNIEGNVIGPDPRFMSINAWIDISEEQGQSSVHYSLAEMHAISISE